MGRFARGVLHAIRVVLKRLFRIGSNIPDWILKAIYIGIAAAGIDQFWLSQQPWYADMPMTGYSFQQKLLQERFEDSGNRSPVILFDISQAFPSGNRMTLGTDLQADTERERHENLIQLGNLIKEIAAYKPKAIAIDWQIAPADSEVGRSKGKPKFSAFHTALFRDIKAVVDSGIPVVFGADWARGRLNAGALLPEPELEPYAATLAVPDPLVGPYHAGARVEDRDGLEPLAVKVAEIVRGTHPDEEPIWSRESWPGFSTVLQDDDEDSGESFWVNYEAVSALLKECFQLSEMNGNNEVPMITTDEVGERLRDRVVLLGDVRDRNPSDSATLPVTTRTLANPENYLGEIFAGPYNDPAEERRVLRNQMAVSASAGVLHQASAIHTLLHRPLRSFSSNWSEFGFAIAWGLVWGLIGEIAGGIMFRFLKLEHNTAFAEMHLLALDFILATAFASTVLMWLSSLTYLHAVIVPLVPAMVMATIAEAVMNICYAVYVLRRREGRATAVE